MAIKALFAHQKLPDEKDDNGHRDYLGPCRLRWQQGVHWLFKRPELVLPGGARIKFGCNG